MPRLSLWQNGAHDNDYRFIDRQVAEQFTIGGVGIMVHKYLGVQDQGATGDLTQPSTGNDSELAIQDLLLLENRDRKYETDIYELRGHFNVADFDMEMGQFGMFISSDSVYMTFHLNDMTDTMGRKLMVGDVLELPNLKEFNSLEDDVPAALKRFYVVEDATRSGEGFSPTWWPHLWRIKTKPMVDSQEYSQILNQIATDANNNPTTSTIRDLLSTYNQEIANNQAVIGEAEQEVPESGYDTSEFFVMNTNADRSPADPDDPEATPDQNGWTDGYLTGDGLAPNGHPVVSAIAFPDSPTVGDFVLRTDYLPNRLFRYSGSRWIKVEDKERTTLTHGFGQTQRDSFVENTTITNLDDNTTVPEKQSLFEALRLQTDNVSSASVVADPVDPTPIPTDAPFNYEFSDEFD